MLKHSVAAGTDWTRRRKGITVDEAGGLLWLQISNESSAPDTNARVSEVMVENVTLKKLACRFQTTQHPQKDCQNVGVLDFNSDEPPVSMRMSNVEVLSGGDAGWSCTGPPMALATPATRVSPPLPHTCAAMLPWGT